MTSKVIYENEYYEVHVVPEDTETPYHLVSKEFGVVESKETNRPQVLVYAEQFNQMLKTEFHKKVVSQVDPYQEAFDFSSVPTHGGGH